MEIGLPKIETYKVEDHYVYVIREDLGSPFPMPNNSKIRGIEAKLIQLKERGVKTVASQDTSISRIGWGVSYITQKLDMIHYNFYAEKKTMNFYQRMSKSFGGRLVPIHGTFSSAFRALASKYLRRHQIDAYFLPIGVSMPEAVTANADLVSKLPPDLFEGTLITCVSSGTICAGLLLGIMRNELDTQIIGVVSSQHHRSEDLLYHKAYVADSQAVTKFNFCHSSRFTLTTVNLGYEYKQKEKCSTPFPCDLYLDRKAWKYLCDKIQAHCFKEPITFWNIGGEWNPEIGLTGDLRGDGLVTKQQVDDYVKHIL